MEKMIPTWYYQQFDADYSSEFPGEGYGGWKNTSLPINPDKTAIVLMHAWDTGTIEQYPGWFRAVEYIPRATHICDNLLPHFLKKVRSSNIRLIHIASSNQIVNDYPGYAKTLEICGEDTFGYERVEEDETIKKLNYFRGENVFVGSHNKEDVARGMKHLDFYPTARPLDNEEIVCTSEQLLNLCKKYGINHLIYTGFAINMCLTVSPGGFVDMSRYGIMCSAIKELVTAVENKESCRNEANKNYGLWYIAILSGFVYEMGDIEKYLLD
ncbi:MAG TPA: hypothetical protein PK733_01605 [Clostridiales bacterium]|nr:hypothetical protein [Clostridiales bacterium]